MFQRVSKKIGIRKFVYKIVSKKTTFMTMSLVTKNKMETRVEQIYIPSNMDAAEERGLNNFFRFCATVNVGLERLCAVECERKLACKVHQGRGRIYFEIQRKDLDKIKELRSVENLFVVVADIESFAFSTDESIEEVLDRLYELPAQLNWEAAIDIWKEFNELSSNSPVPNFLPLLKNTEQTKNAGPTKTLETNKTTEANRIVPRFRVTCTRTHSPPNQKHPFTSMQAAAKFGGAINDRFGWIVDLENFDLEVLLNIVDTKVVVGVSLTKESLFRRNIVNFGPTTLRSTLAYCLAIAADIKEGDIVCDPLCGSGAISIEISSEWPCSFNISGDNFHSAPRRTQDNVAYVNKQRSSENKECLKVDIFWWDACHLPLKTNSVDVFITDLPFGKKSGSLVKNWELYPKVLQEMARACQTNTGRAVILTKDKKAVSKALNLMAHVWRKRFTHWINIGGLQAGVYVLKRTSTVI